MHTQYDLIELYSQWRRLTEAEGEAINQGRWQDVDHQQALKQELKDRILLATENWQSDYPVRLTQAEYDRRFRAIISELIVMESANHATLCARREALQQERGRAGQTLQNLRGLNRTYGRQQQTCWHSYS